MVNKANSFMATKRNDHPHPKDHTSRRPKMAHSVLHLTSTPRLLPLRQSGGGFSFTAIDLSAGIHRVTLLLDAAEFDWQRLYFPMHSFGNKGQRTGPWDFSFERFEPVLPAWWANVNGQRLGLAVVARLAPSQVQNRRMQVTWCFEHKAPGDAIIHMEPFNQSDVSLIRMTLEAEPYDRMRVPDRRWRRSGSYEAAQVRKEVWNGWDRKLKQLGASHQRLLKSVAEFALAGSMDTEALRLRRLGAKGVLPVPKPGARPLDPEMLPLLAYLWRARGDHHALLVARQIIRQKLELEHWGNQCASGYGHDADMGVASVIEPLAHAYHWFGDALDEPGDPLRKRLRDKLRLQMQRFFTLLLVWADYWGGSILQDHGHRSVCRFGVAAINMLGVLPEAPHWLAFVATRMDRVLKALPDDGGIPSSSYYKLHLYLDDMTSWRDAWLHVSGEDIFDRPLFKKVVSFVTNRLDSKTNEVMLANPRGDRASLYAGWGFLAAIASKFDDANAAALLGQLVRKYKTCPMAQRPASTWTRFIEHMNPSIKPGPLRPDSWDFRPAIGQASYRPPRSNVCVAVVTPAKLYHQSHLNNPCDRAYFAPFEGHFTVHLGEQAMLLTAEGGYRMRSCLGAVLLIDDRGGYDDISYSMGTPGISYRGQQVETAWYDPATGIAGLRLNLAAMYPREVGLLSYVREFQLRPDGLRLRDCVVASAPHHFGWCFQTYARRSVESTGPNQWRIKDRQAALELAGHAVETKLTSRVQPTDVVWAYGNENGSQSFKHVRFSTRSRVSVLTADFNVTWPVARGRIRS